MQVSNSAGWHQSLSYLPVCSSAHSHPSLSSFQSTLPLHISLCSMFFFPLPGSLSPCSDPSHFFCILLFCHFVTLEGVAGKAMLLGDLVTQTAPCLAFIIV